MQEGADLSSDGTVVLFPEQKRRGITHTDGGERKHPVRAQGIGASISLFDGESIGMVYQQTT